MEVTGARYQQSIKPRRRRSYKRILSAFLVILMLAYAGLALAKDVPDAKLEALELASTPAVVEGLSWPASGQAAFGTLSDGLLASKGNEERRPIASITKLVTALAVLEKMPLETGEKGPVFIITQQDVDHYNTYIAKYGSVMPINIGQRITQLDALYGMMLPSANNIADSLAVWVFGSMPEYLIYANDMLIRYGLGDTVVADASGFSPDSQSTPSDLIKLGQKALLHPVLKEIVDTPSFNVPVSGPVNNTNFLLSSDPSAVGIKTGRTDEAGSCLLFAYKFGINNEQTFIGVILGQPNYFGMFSTAERIKESAMPGFKTIEVLASNSVVGAASTQWGGTTDIVTAEPLKVYGWAGSSYKVNISLENTELPISSGQVIGSAGLKDRQDKVKVIVSQQVKKPSLLWRLKNYL